jgi:phosphoglycerate-specific signal transduction histidine kinase
LHCTLSSKSTTQQQQQQQQQQQLLCVHDLVSGLPEYNDDAASDVFANQQSTAIHIS